MRAGFRRECLEEDKDEDKKTTLKMILQEEGKSLQTGFKWLGIKDQWGVLVQKVMRFLVPQKAGIFKNKCRTSIPSK
jgi:hypothetical protein